MSPHAFWPFCRPGLAYQHAFDWLAVQLQAAPGPIAALAPSPFHAGELLRRLPALRLLTPFPDGLEQVTRTLDVTLAAVAPASGTLTAIAWPEPEAGCAEQLEQLQAFLQPRGWLYLVVGGRLSRFLTERRARPCHQLLDAGEAAVLLRACGFSVRRQFGLHGPRAIGWHYAGEAAGRFGRPALRDRAHFSMRRDFVEAGLGRHLSALTLIAAERS